MTFQVKRHLIAPSMVLCVLALAVSWIVAQLMDMATPRIFYYFYNAHDTPAIFAFLIILTGSVFLFGKIPLGAVLTTLNQAIRFRYLLVLVTISLLAAGTVIAYRNHALSMDEYAPMFQAQLFSHGKLWAELPPDMLGWLFHDQFLTHFFHSSRVVGWVASNYWPGYAVLLAPFMKLHAPWLLNPLLAGGSLLLLVHLARRLLPQTEARGWVLVLALASPQFTINAISYYSMSAHLFLNLLFASLLIQPTLGRTFLAGLVGSFAVVLHQPLPHLLFGLPWLIWLAGRSRPIRHLGTLLLGYLPLGLLLGAGWLILKLHITSMDAAPGLSESAAAPQELAAGVLERVKAQLGFFRWPDAEVLQYRLIGLLKLFLWAVPGLPFVALIGYLKCRHVSGLRVLGWSALCSLVGFFFIPLSQGHGWGYRYFHQAWGVLPLLAAAALVSIEKPRADWIRIMGLLTVASLLFLTPLRVMQVHGFIDRHLDQLPPLAAEGHQICFLATYRGYYAEDLVQNDPFLRNPVLILDSHGRESDERLMRQRFPAARRVYDNGFDSVWALE